MGICHLYSTYMRSCRLSWKRVGERMTNDSLKANGSVNARRCKRAKPSNRWPVSAGNPDQLAIVAHELNLRLGILQLVKMT